MTGILFCTVNLLCYLLRTVDMKYHVEIGLNMRGFWLNVGGISWIVRKFNFFGPYTLGNNIENPSFHFHSCNSNTFLVAITSNYQGTPISHALRYQSGSSGSSSNPIRNLTKSTINLTCFFTGRWKSRI